MSRMPRAAAHRTRLALATALILTAVLSGCAPTKPDIGASTAKTLEASVLTVTKAAAAGDPAAALSALDALQAQLTAATASGAVSANRQARIQASIDLVRADLTAALPPKPTSTPVRPQPTSVNEGKANGNGPPSKGKGKKNGGG